MVLTFSSLGVVNVGFDWVGCNSSFKVHLLLLSSVMLLCAVDERGLLCFIGGRNNATYPMSID